MNVAGLIERMSRTPRGIEALVGGLSEADARWKPASGAWSILEIVRHLGDEEVEDFRARVRATLEGTAWAPIDPEGWARDRRYNEGDLGEALARFARERAASIEWLRGLGEVDWGRVHEHPKLGPIRAGDVMVSWAAHDALHVRQIAKRLYELVGRDGVGFSAEYAGAW